MAVRDLAPALHGTDVDDASPSPFFVVGTDRIRHLRDGVEAFPAMLAAIDAARREILLEMYWIGNDPVGRMFRDRLARCAAAGVIVRVLYDGIGSWGLPSSFWTPLVAAGGLVVEHGPLAPWCRRFRFARIRFRDHRKVLVVDSVVALCGGINLALPWLPREKGGGGWRDDALEIRGETAVHVRTAIMDALNEEYPVRIREAPATSEGVAQAVVLVNRVDGLPNRRIRRAYLDAICKSQQSIDIASPYFLPGPQFLRALRNAVLRGVRVRVLLPASCDVWVVGMAMVGIIKILLRNGVDVMTYNGPMLHSKTAVLDGRTVVIGSHNLDTLSWRFNLEMNVVVVDVQFAGQVSKSFERDFAHATRLALSVPAQRSLRFRLLAWVFARLRVLL